MEELVDSEGETSITRSLKAIVASESDLINRLKFRGYAFEVKGSRYQPIDKTSTKFHILGKDFDTFKDALQHTAGGYGIKTDVLYDYAKKTGGRLEEALELIFKEQELLLQEKELKKSASAVAKKYGAPRKWIIRTLKSLQKEHPKLSVSELCELIVENYIKKT